MCETSLHVSAVAHDLGVSTEHLCRVLKRHTGLTFVTLLRRTRVRAACRLLQTTTLSMKEIAGRAGFSSASRFDRDFKTGMRSCRRPRIAPVSGVRHRPADREVNVGAALHGGPPSSTLDVFYQLPSSNIKTRQDFVGSRRCRRPHNSVARERTSRPDSAPNCDSQHGSHTATPDVSRRGHVTALTTGKGAGHARCVQSRSVCSGKRAGAGHGARARASKRQNGRDHRCAGRDSTSTLQRIRRGVLCRPERV